MPLNTRKLVSELHAGDDVRMYFNNNALCPLTVTVKNTHTEDLVFKLQSGVETRRASAATAETILPAGVLAADTQSFPGDVKRTRTYDSYGGGVGYTDCRPDGYVFTDPYVRPNSFGLFEQPTTVATVYAAMLVNGDAVAGSFSGTALAALTPASATDTAAAQAIFDTAFGAGNTNVLAIFKDGTTSKVSVVFEWIGDYASTAITVTLGAKTGAGAAIVYTDRPNDIPSDNYTDTDEYITVEGGGCVSLSYSVKATALAGPYVKIITTAGHGFVEVAPLDNSVNLIQN